MRPSSFVLARGRACGAWLATVLAMSAAGSAFSVAPTGATLAEVSIRATDGVESGERTPAEPIPESGDEDEDDSSLQTAAQPRDEPPEVPAEATAAPVEHERARGRVGRGRLERPPRA